MASDLKGDAHGKKRVYASSAILYVLFAIGAGTLFPIVIAFCGGIALVSTIVGAAVVAAFHVH